MSTLSYDAFLEKYILNLGVKDIEKSIKEELGDDSDLFDIIMESVGETFYKDYLDGKLDYIEEMDKPDNNNENKEQ